MSVGEKEMEPIKEEDTPPNSANSVKFGQRGSCNLPSPLQTAPSSEASTDSMSQSSPADQPSHTADTATWTLATGVAIVQKT